MAKPLFTSDVLTELLFLSTSLKRLSLTTASLPFIHDPIYLSHQGRSSLIEHLRLKSSHINLPYLFALTPALRTLDSMVDISYFSNNIHLQSPDNLEQLSIEVSDVSMMMIERLLNSMTRLVHLTIVVDHARSDFGDGSRWERLLNNIMTFKFEFTFYKSTMKQEKINLDSFRTPFWIDKTNGMSHMTNLHITANHSFIRIRILLMGIHGSI